MLNYYKERLAEGEEKLRLARIGYQAEIKSMGERLMNANSWEETDLVFTSIKKSREAVDLLEGEVKACKERYEQEANKLENEQIKDCEGK